MIHFPTSFDDYLQYSFGYKSYNKLNNIKVILQFIIHIVQNNRVNNNIAIRSTRNNDLPCLRQSNGILHWLEMTLTYISRDCVDRDDTTY